MEEELFSSQLNTVLVETFRNILKVEEQMVQSNEHLNLSISEIHLLEAAGKNNTEGRTISALAEEMAITLSSVTIAVNKLEKKGYVCKTRGTQDGRTVYVALTPRGKKVDHIHSAFHKKMVANISEGLDDHERDAMLMGIIKLNDFFKQKLTGLEESK